MGGMGRMDADILSHLSCLSRLSGPSRPSCLYFSIVAFLTKSSLGKSLFKYAFPSL